MTGYIAANWEVFVAHLSALFSVQHLSAHSYGFTTPSCLVTEQTKGTLKANDRTSRKADEESMEKV